MSEQFIMFRNFHDYELAENTAEKLRQSGIECIVENNQKLLESALANNAFVQDVSIKLKPEDFTKANEILINYYKDQTENVDEDYYLFNFTDEELIEIISKPDEWGHFDYQLAQKILKERGKEINPEIVSILKSKRLKDLSEPTPVHKYWIYAGYIFSILGSLFGLVIGLTLIFNKNTLPDGSKMYAYNEVNRNHGTRMLLVSMIFICFWLVIRWKYLLNN